MKTHIALIALIAFLSSACHAQVLISSDDFGGKTLGVPNGVTFAAGKDGQAAVLDAQTDSIEYPAKCFSVHAGRIEMDVRLTKPLSADHRSYCLLSDVGAAIANTGSMTLYWHEGAKHIQFGIYNNGWNWVTSKGVEFEPDRWYHIAIGYGPAGMSIEVDGVLRDSNTYPGGFSNTSKLLGLYDGYVFSPPALIDNLRTYRVPADHLTLSANLVCPSGGGVLDNCKISYGVQEPSKVDLSLVQDGKVARTLLSKDMDKGEYEESITGKGLADGVYDIRLTITRAGTDKQLAGKVRIDGRWKRPDKRWTQGNFFPTGAWYFWGTSPAGKPGGPEHAKAALEYYNRTLKDLGEHGVNLIVFCWVPKVYHKMLLDACQANGVKAIVNLDAVTSAIGSGSEQDRMDLFDIAWKAIKDVKDHPAVYGYYIVDEPGPNMEVAQRINEAKQVLEVLDPAHPSFLCLNARYEKILPTIDPRVLLIDVYVLWENWDRNLDGYVGEMARGKRNAGDRPFWLISQQFGKKGTWKVPTPEECRAQTWIALAHDCKGLISFLYQSTPDGEFLQGLVGLDDKPADGRYAEMAKLHADIAKLSPILLKLKPAEFELPVKSDRIVAKAFVDDTGARYAILASKDTQHSMLARWDGEPATDVLTGASTGASIALEPGGGRLLRLR